MLRGNRIFGGSETKFFFFLVRPLADYFFRRVTGGFVVFLYFFARGKTSFSVKYVP